LATGSGLAANDNEKIGKSNTEKPDNGWRHCFRMKNRWMFRNFVSEIIFFSIRL
jgi:hypothetical protein